MPAIGASERRKEGPEKLRGRAGYLDDLDLSGCLFGATLRSTISRGRVIAARFDPAFPWDECVVVTATDIPGENSVLLIRDDQPLLAGEEVMHAGEAILLVAHADRATALAAIGHIEVEYEAAEPVLDMEEAARRGDLLHELHIETGDVEAVLSSAEHVAEAEYRLGHQEQAYIENNGVAAWFEDDGSLVVTGSMQCPYYVKKALVPMFALDEDKVRVIQAVTGGGFGGKEDYPSVIAGHAALLAFKARKPVKIVYDRHEDMLATTKRHPARVRHRSAVDVDGKLVAQDIDILLDGGAYATLSQVVLSRAILHATGPYECENVRVHARAVRTNTVPNGAFRGFGAPQAQFGAELHWEQLAATSGIDSLTLRQRNLVVEGSCLATGQVLSKSVGAEAVLTRCVARSRYHERKQHCAHWNRRADVTSVKGVGLALVFHGAGFTGSGEAFLASRASVALTSAGVVRVEASSTEMGQGATTTFAQIAADGLGLPASDIEIQNPDTAKVPDSGPTVASRTCMIVGGLVAAACAQLRDAVVAVAGEFPTASKGLVRAARTLCDGADEKRFTAQYQPPPGIQWDEDSYRGDAYAVYSYAAAVVELSVDKQTYEVTVDKVTTAQEIGKAINPQLAVGQIAGGTAQGLGYALLEHAVYADGRMTNAGLTDYVIPTALDVPDMDIEIVELPYEHGPMGAKGLGEMPMDVPAPAVAAALHDATGLFFTAIPILPEHIARAIRDRDHRQ